VIKHLKHTLKTLQKRAKISLHSYRTGFYENWTDPHIPAVQNTLQHYLKEPDQKQINILEVGCFEGRTTL
jgi:hypothetical protein